MNKSFRFLEKICNGTKTIESRWYMHRSPPWGKIEKGDIIYFKNSGESVKLKASIESVLSYENLTPKKVRALLQKYSRGIGIETKDFSVFFQKFKYKKYCLLIFLKDIQEVKPFQVSKKGFGAMSAWINVENHTTIKI